MQRALVVIDVQNIYGEGSPLEIVHPPFAGSLRRVLGAVRTAGRARIPVVLVQHEAPVGAPDDGLWDLRPEVARLGHDHLVLKSLPSAFAGTDLHPWLQEHGVDTLTLVGYMTQNCVDSTAREASHRGYAVEVLLDATGTLPLSNAAGHVDARTLHETTLTVLHSRFAAVADSDAWESAVQRGVRLPAGDIMASARREGERV